MNGGTVSGEVEAVRRRAAELAARLSPVARRSATIAQERAILRMVGVDGLDRAGHPLAESVTERYCSPDRDRLARGVILPFAVALLEYDLPARDLALEVASGAIDLGLEAELLDRPGRLAAAEAHASRLLAAALARFDANRTAARDMRDVLGLADEPWLGVAVHATEVGPAAEETKSLVGEGADVVLVRVPASWEFAEARRQAGLETPGLFEVEGRRGAGGKGSRGRGSVARLTDPRRGVRGQPPLAQRLERDLVPAGSQRGLAAIRKAADDAAAERGCYASLMTVTSAFAAPEQAVVAAFERIDLVEADPIREIVEDNVDPERALADHAFAHWLHARAGCRVVMGPGPLALGADVASGIPSDASTRAGRALALQALGVELALADGLAADRLLLGAVPDWVTGDGDVWSFRATACSSMSHGSTTSRTAARRLSWRRSRGPRRHLWSWTGPGAASPNPPQTSGRPLRRPRPCGRRWATERCTDPLRSWRCGRCGPRTRRWIISRTRAGGVSSGPPDVATSPSDSAAARSSSAPRAQPRATGC